MKDFRFAWKLGIIATLSILFEYVSGAVTIPLYIIIGPGGGSTYFALGTAISILAVIFLLRTWQLRMSRGESFWLTSLSIFTPIVAFFVLMLLSFVPLFFSRSAPEWIIVIITLPAGLFACLLFEDIGALAKNGDLQLPGGRALILPAGFIILFLAAGAADPILSGGEFVRKYIDYVLLKQITLCLIWMWWFAGAGGSTRDAVPGLAAWTGYRFFEIVRTRALTVINARRFPGEPVCFDNGKFPVPDTRFFDMDKLAPQFAAMLGVALLSWLLYRLWTMVRHGPGSRIVDS